MNTFSYGTPPVAASKKRLGTFLLKKVFFSKILKQEDLKVVFAELLNSNM